MKRTSGSVGRVFGPAAEDWMLGVMMMAAVVLTVVGVRSCEHQAQQQQHDAHAIVAR